jgi:hypothetical protein
VYSIDDLADQISALYSDITSATARWLMLLAEFDEREGDASLGAKSTAHYISWRCGISLGPAREYVRVARRLHDLPEIMGAFRRGELSYSKVRALTRVEGDPDEDELLGLARAVSASQLERLISAYRSTLTVETDEARAYAERSVTWSWDEDGCLVLRGRLPAAQGAVLVAALEAARDEPGPPPKDVSAETSRTPVAARNADALVAVAETSVTSTAPSSADLYQVMVHVDATTLPLDTEDDGRCELEAGPQIPRETARRLACDASLIRVIERDGKPLSIGRKTRTIPPALRRALRSRDGGCMFPGCTTTQHVDAHHIDHWVDGGKTDISNLVNLCRHHHRLVHEGGFSIRRRGHELVFMNPSGDALPRVPVRPRGDCDAVRTVGAFQSNPKRSIALMPTDGGPMNLGWEVEGMHQIYGTLRE